MDNIAIVLHVFQLIDVLIDQNIHRSHKVVTVRMDKSR